MLNEVAKVQKRPPAVLSLLAPGATSYLSDVTRGPRDYFIHNRTPLEGKERETS